MACVRRRGQPTAVASPETQPAPRYPVRPGRRGALRHKGDSEVVDMTRARWRTSSYSSTNGGNCVEVADNLPGRVLVRDTKDRDGGTLTFQPAAWRVFVGEVSRRP
jgi:Domain of unknown function (DUF397)